MADDQAGALKNESGWDWRKKLAAAAAGIFVVAVVGWLLWPQGDIKQAALKAKSGKALLAKAQAFYDQNDCEKAIPLLEKVKLIGDQGTGKAGLVRDLLISCYWKEKDHDKALSELKLAVKERPNDADSLYRLGVLSAELNNPRQSAEYLRRAISIKPDKVQYHDQFAETLTTLSKYRDAIDEWQIVVRLLPEGAPYRATAYGKIGELYLATRRPKLAAAAFEAGLEITPEDQALKTQFDLANE